MWNKFKQWAKKNKKKIGIVAILLIILIPFYQRQTSDQAEPKEIEYTSFLKMVDEKQVKEVDILLTSPTFTFTDINEISYVTDNPKIQTFKDDLLKKGINVNEVDATQAKAMQDNVSRMVTLIIYIVIFVFAMQYIQGRMGKSKKKNEITSENVMNVNFENIAGNEEAKSEMKELVDFLKNPKRYSKMGAKLPKGAILYGPPGTGKTLMAKAIAGEAGVPFFFVSGSDFVEMYVGLGARRVRELFEQARKKAPAIIFIDEIEQLGKSRDSNSHDEQKQTLNAMLAEMDGFSSKDGVIVIGATNRLEDMDSAFIRPGRFDRHIAIGLPDQKARLDILKVHAKNKPLDKTVDLESLSKMTIGLAGASLEALMNEAAIIATVRNRDAISNEDIDDAYFKMIMKGHKKKSGDEKDEDQLRLIAWHEAGHALVAKTLTNKEVPKVTIVPSTSGAGGVAFVIPKKMGLNSKEELINDIKIDYAGRAAEYLLLGSQEKITTGAYSDIQSATRKIKGMITQYGMSDTYGMLNLDMFQGSTVSADNKEVLKEASEMSKKLYEDTILLLSANKPLLEDIANELLKKETLVEDELNAIIAKHRVGITEMEKEAS